MASARCAAREVDRQSLTGEEPTVRLRDRIALVTGAANGIGRGIALRFGAEGAVVLVTDVDEAGAREAARAIIDAGGRAEAMRLDVARPDEVEAVYERVALAHGRLDVQVSNAGSTDRMPFLETTVAFWDRLLTINLRGVFLGDIIVAVPKKPAMLAPSRS